MSRRMKLADWLDGLDLDPPTPRMTRSAFAARIGASVTLITGYCNETVWPGREKMQRIRRETGGAVLADDFLQSEAAQ